MMIRKTLAPLVALIRPQQLGLEDNATSGWLDVSQFESIMAVAQMGEADGGEVALTFNQAKADADGALDEGTSKPLEAWAGGTLAADAATLQADYDPALLDTNGGFKFVQAVLTSDDGGSEFGGPTAGAVLLGYSPRHTDAVTAAGADTVGTGPAEEGP